MISSVSASGRHHDFVVDRTGDRTKADARLPPDRRGGKPLPGWLAPWQV
jgi:hypothetical protein